MFLVPWWVKCSPVLASPEPTPSLGASFSSFLWLSQGHTQGSACCAICMETLQKAPCSWIHGINMTGVHSASHHPRDQPLTQQLAKCHQMTENEELRAGEIGVGENVQCSRCVF